MFPYLLSLLILTPVHGVCGWVCGWVDMSICGVVKDPSLWEVAYHLSYLALMDLTKENLGGQNSYLPKPGTEFSGFLFPTIKNPLSRARRKQHKAPKMKFQNTPRWQKISDKISKAPNLIFHFPNSHKIKSHFSNTQWKIEGNGERLLLAFRNCSFWKMEQGGTNYGMV